MKDTYTLKLNRLDICKLLTACTTIKWGMIEEMNNDPDCPEYRRDHVLPNSIKMWEQLYEQIETQLDEQDKRQDWYQK